MLQKTISERKVKFRSTAQKDEFIEVLRNNIRNYFKENNISRYANAELWIKVAISYAFWIGIYSLIISDVLSSSPILLIAAFSLLGFANIFITSKLWNTCEVQDITNKTKQEIYKLLLDFV